MVMLLAVINHFTVPILNGCTAIGFLTLFGSVSAGSESNGLGVLISGITDVGLYSFMLIFSLVFGGFAKTTPGSYLNYLEESGNLRLKGVSDVAFRGLRFFLSFGIAGSESSCCSKKKGLHEGLLEEKSASMVEKTGGPRVFPATQIRLFPALFRWHLLSSHRSCMHTLGAAPAIDMLRVDDGQY